MKTAFLCVCVCEVEAWSPGQAEEMWKVASSAEYVQSLDNELNELTSRTAFQDTKRLGLTLWSRTWPLFLRGSPFTARAGYIKSGRGREEVSPSWSTTSGVQMWRLFLRAAPWPRARHDWMLALLSPEGVDIGHSHSGSHSTTRRHELSPGRAVWSYRQDRDLTAGGYFYCGRRF